MTRAALASRLEWPFRIAHVAPRVSFGLAFGSIDGDNFTPGLSGMRVPSSPCRCGWLRWAGGGMLGVRRTTHNLASPAANVGRPRRGWWQSAGRHRPTAGGQRRGTRRQAHCGGRREPRWPLAEAKCGTGPVAAATGLAFPILRPLLGSRRPAGWQLVGVPRPPRDHPPAAPAGAARSPSRATPATAAIHLQATPPRRRQSRSLGTGTVEDYPCGW